MQNVKVITPATVANVVCGFDILGFALNEPCDELTLDISDEPGIHIINEDEFNLPTDPEKNVSGAALLALLEERQAARKAKDFKRSDAIREELKTKGWMIEDTPKGPRLKRI